MEAALRNVRKEGVYFIGVARFTQLRYKPKTRKTVLISKFVEVGRSWRDYLLVIITL